MVLFTSHPFLAPLPGKSDPQHDRKVNTTTRLEISSTNSAQTMTQKGTYTEARQNQKTHKRVNKMETSYI